jgi:hypothetical protein
MFGPSGVSMGHMTAVMAVMHVADVEVGALAAEAAGAQGGQCGACASARPEGCLIHELGQRRDSEEFLDGPPSQGGC